MLGGVESAKDVAALKLIVCENSSKSHESHAPMPLSPSLSSSLRPSLSLFSLRVGNFPSPEIRVVEGTDYFSLAVLLTLFPPRPLRLNKYLAVA